MNVPSVLQLCKPTIPVPGSFFAQARSADFLNKMEETTFSRKLEKSGRLMIPIKLREEMNMIPGREYHFFTTIENGRKFICIDCGPEIADTTLEQAMKIVQASGMKIVQNAD